jgi:hypothetical protein
MTPPPPDAAGGPAVLAPAATPRPEHSAAPAAPRVGSPELVRALAEVKGQAQFLLYLADQIEDSLLQLADQADASHTAFLCKVLGMYSSQLESKHQGLGDKIAETCQEVYITVREFDAL